MTPRPELPEAAPPTDGGALGRDPGADFWPDEGRVADATADNWVDAIAPAPTRPYLRLSRADRPIGTWLLFIPCLWGLSLAAAVDGFRPWDFWLAVSCGAGAFLMRGAGCTWNDVTDRDFDAQVARTKSRPIPAGQVTVPQALAWMVAQSFLAAWILFSYNKTAIALGLGSLLLVAIYPFAKRFTWWPQIFLGLAFNWGALLAWAAHANEVPVAAVALYVSGIAWTLFYDTIYAHQDKEDDALIGVKSTARLFGDNSAWWLKVFLIAAVSGMALAVLLALLPLRDPLQLAIALCGVWAFGWHMVRQMSRLNIDDPTSCLSVFRSNRDAGLIPALFLAIAALL